MISSFLWEKKKDFFAKVAPSVGGLWKLLLSVAMEKSPIPRARAFWTCVCVCALFLVWVWNILAPAPINYQRNTIHQLPPL